MTKAPISLQELRRSIYVKAKAEPAWRFWDCTSMSASWKHFAKPTRWRNKTRAHRALTGSRLKPLRKAERRVF